MSPEQIKAIETSGARNAIMTELCAAKSELSEAINSYIQIEPTFYQANTKQLECAKLIKGHIAKIAALINHLQPGT